MPKTLLKAVNLNDSAQQFVKNIRSVLVQLDDKAGYIIGIADLRNVDEGAEDFLDMFINQVERSAGTIASKDNLQHGFEQIVQSINERVAKASEEYNWNFDTKHINALIGLAGGDRLYLTGVGDLTALFLHKNDQQHYKVFNLFRGIQTEHHIPDWQKLFTVVLDGDVCNGDVFLIGNKEIPQQIDNEDLHQILVTLPPLGASERIRQYFPATADLSIVILQAEKSVDVEAMKVSGAKSSLDHFDRTKETTSRMLEHQRPHTNDWMMATKNTIKTTTNITISVLNVTLAILMRVTKDILKLASLLIKSNKKQAWTNIKTSTFGKFSLKDTRYKLRRNKKLLFLLLAIAILLIGFITYTAVKNNIKKEQAAYKEVVQDIEKLYDTASASIIYKDTEQAQKLLLDGAGIIANLPVNSDERENKKSELASKFEALLTDLRKITRIETLELLASTPNGEGVAMIGFDNETAYAFSTSGHVYKYNADSANFDVLTAQAPSTFGTPLRSRYDDLNDVLYIFDGRQIAKLDPDQNLYELVSVGNLPSNTIDVEYFARRIYSLSPENEQVYRHERTDSGFGEPEGWIQARTISLRDAISISVDGSVWVLKSDGRLVRYQKGFEETWPKPVIDPSISPSTILWTTDAVENIYLIDKEQSRIIQIDKASGELKNQFKHEAFKEMKGMFERGGAIFVLTPAGLHKFDIE
jgi:hypothetical protein